MAGHLGRHWKRQPAGFLPVACAPQVGVAPLALAAGFAKANSPWQGHFQENQKPSNYPRQAGDPAAGHPPSCHQLKSKHRQGVIHGCLVMQSCLKDTWEKDARRILRNTEEVLPCAMIPRKGFLHANRLSLFSLRT
ncbi:hypothetical protein [Chloracidobacterium thermophilum]|uniref:hypothetical protein n=1 Tax=Chloracidobacterium thermophilum TaxID=458033 RepID=UPI0012FEE260|nr:hypothetical protein [Chloracidobacterium thermophilum]